MRIFLQIPIFVLAISMVPILAIASPQNAYALAQNGVNPLDGSNAEKPASCTAWVSKIPVASTDISAANQSCLDELAKMDEQQRADILDTYLSMNGQFIDPLGVSELAENPDEPSYIKIKTIEALSARRADIDMGLSDIDALIKQAEADFDAVSLANLNFAASAMALNEGDFAGMRSYAETARDYAQAHMMLAIQPKIFNSIGVAATVTGDYVEALDNYQRAIDIASQTDNKYRLATVSANIGNMFSDLGDDEQAMRYYGEALTYASSTDRVNPLFTAGMLTNIASVRTEAGKHEEALPLYERAREIIEATPRRELDSFLNYSQARSLHGVGKTDLAMPMAEKAVEQSLQMQDQARAGAALVWMAEIHLEAGDNDKALAALQKASEAMGVESNEPETLLSGDRDLIWTMNYTESMATVLARLGQHRQATAFSNIAFKLSDDRFEQEKMDAAVNADLLFSLRARQNELNLSKAEATLASQKATLADERATVAALQAQRSRLLAATAIIGSLIATLFGFQAYRSYRSQKHLADAKQVYLQETQHRIKNNLQLLTSILRLDGLKVKENEGPDIRQEVTDRIQTMGLIQDHLYNQGDQTTLDSNVFLSDLLVMIDNSLGQPNITLEQDIVAVDVDVSVVTQLGLALSELVSNAYKHAFNSDGGTIHVHLEEIEQGHVTLTVRDNGKGLDASEPAKNNTSSIGMGLIEGFADTLGADLVIETGPQGTEISLKGIACAFGRNVRSKV